MNIDRTVDHYKLKQPLYEKLAEEVSYVLSECLAEGKIKPVSMSRRVKTLESFREKITRKKYSNPMNQMQDLAGVRVVCAYQVELDLIEKIIEDNFEIIERTDKAEELGVNKMGYSGKAFVVKFGAGYSGGRYKDLTSLYCEIQYRTVLQDAWAIIDHQLVYKDEKFVPQRVRRDINNVASLLEVAQGVFDRVRAGRDEYIQEIKDIESDEVAFLNLPLNFDTVVAYSKRKFPDLDTSDYVTQLLLEDIRNDNYPTLSELDRVVEQASEAVKSYHRENPELFKFSTDFLTKSLGFVDLDFRKQHAFSKKTREAFENYESLL